MLPLPTEHMLEEVYDRSGDPSHAQYDGLLFHAGKRPQSGEMNEMQQYLHRRMDGIAGTIFKDGDVPEGGNPLNLVDVPGANVRVHAGKVFIKGKFYTFDDANLNIPVDKAVELGVRWYQVTVDETDDGSLLSQAVRRRGYAEPGAYRVKSWVEWGWRADDTTSDGGTGVFYPIYSVDNGTIIEENTNPGAELVYKALRRYDMDGNGNYIARGLRVSYTSTEGGNYVFQLAAGSAHILGDIIDRKSDSRLVYPIDPDENTAVNEYHTFVPDTAGKMNVVVSRPPLASIASIIGQKKKTNPLIRGGAANGKDVIDVGIASIVSIISVKKGGTTYVAGVDYNLDGDEINWNPGGVEPAAGESYDVEFTYMSTVNAPDAMFGDYFVVSNYVANTQLLVTYNYKLPRIDLIVMKHEGTIARLKGVPSLQNPSTPQAGPNEIALATIEYSWFTSPSIRNVAVRAVHMSDLEDMRTNIFELYRLHAQEKLRNDANQKDPSVKIGVFVDSFKDDTQRDNGTAQTAAIVSGFLMLPLMAEAMELDGAAANEVHTLPFEPVVAISQPLATGSSKINPYQVFDPPDGFMTLSPTADSWLIFGSQFNSQVTSLLVNSGIASRLDSVDARKARRDRQLEAVQTGVELVDDFTLSMESAQENTTGIAVRQRQVSVRVTGMRPMEPVLEAFFDGVPLEDMLPAAADINGVLTASFMIPPNIPTGKKLVYMTGGYGTYAEAVYVAEFIIGPWNPPRRRDPVAQSFVPSEDIMTCGLDVKFTAKGPTMAGVVAQVREMINGYPGSDVIAEGTIRVEDMTILNTVNYSQAITSANWRMLDQARVNTYFPDESFVRIGYDDDGSDQGDNWAVGKLTMPNDLVGSHITNATVRIRIGSGAWGGYTFGARRITEAFDINSVTWNRKSGVTPWATPGGTVATTNLDIPTKTAGLNNNEWLTLDITNIVRAWASGQPNHGIQIYRVTGHDNNDERLINLDATTSLVNLNYKPAATGLLGENWTRVNWQVPAFLRGGQEYCYTLITTDPGHSIAFARLGEIMPAEMNNGAIGVISKNAYNPGTMFDSPNNTTWIARPLDDMTFRLLRCHFTATEATVALGKVATGSMTDVMMRAPIQRFSGDTNIDFTLALPAGAGTKSVETNETLPLTSRISGDLYVSANLKGTSKLSPILYAQPAVVIGNLTDAGSYVTRRSKAAQTYNATVIFKALLPAGATVQPAVATANYAGGNRVVVDNVHQFSWLNMELDSSEADDDGFVEQIWKLSGVKGVTLENWGQVRLMLNGAPNARPLVKDFQFFTK